MKLFLCLIGLVTLGIGPTLGVDFLKHLLSTEKLVEIPQLSKTNLGSDRLYITNNGNEHLYEMSYQMYLPNRGGPGAQSEIFPIKMLAPSGKPLAASEEASEEIAPVPQPQRPQEAASEEPEEV